MGRKSLATNRNAKIPKYITDIAMTPEQYYEFKVYIKSIVLPGTPAFEFKRLSINDNKQIYSEWLNNALKDIGPKFFSEGANSLVWPKDHDRYVFFIFSYSTVDFVFQKDAWIS